MLEKERTIFTATLWNENLNQVVSLLNTVRTPLFKHIFYWGGLITLITEYMRVIIVPTNRSVSTLNCLN
jgi:hypothetical protein